MPKRGINKGLIQTHVGGFSYWIRRKQERIGIDIGKCMDLIVEIGRQTLFMIYLLCEGVDPGSFLIGGEKVKV